MANFENITNIVFLEPECSFSEIAKDEFCQKYNLQCFSSPIKTIKQIVDHVSNNPDSIGVLPVENTQDGTIRESLDCLITSKNQNIRILSEITLPIEYCLLSKNTEFYNITGVIGTPRLISKCQDFITKEMPYNISTVESPTMIDAAIELSNRNLTYASIGNKKIAETYRLNILKENIHDDKFNQTKYILIGDIETKPTEQDRTTVAFRTNHTPGALLEILKIFLENGINLSYIASRPSKFEPNEYIFFVSFEGHLHGSNLLATMDKIRPKTSFFRYLGSYEIDKTLI
jgi:prephenate dehydratase